jgi:hypothetical protein
MSIKKKKKTNSNEKELAARHFARFLERMEFLMIAFAGPSALEKIPKRLFEGLYMVRYPALKAKAATGSGVTKEKVVQFNKLMNHSLTDIYITLENGTEILLSWYLSEGTLLVNYFYSLEGEEFTGATELKAFFAPYFPETKGREVLEQSLINLVEDVTISLSDFNHTILKADVEETACFDLSSNHNDIFLHQFKLPKTNITVNDKKRTIYQVCWVDGSMNPIWAKTKPSLIGFKTGSLDIPLDVYIQQHALDRLKERLDIIPGIMHFITFLIFQEKTIPHHKMKDYSLVEFRLSDLKTGYLLVRLVDAKLLIQSFLFLTNNNTPEGEKLKDMVALEKEDKTYLQIDTLPAFNAYHFEKNERLSKLFTAAGCGSLLKLGHLKEFSVLETKDKDPESIIKYLDKV